MCKINYDDDDDDDAVGKYRKHGCLKISDFFKSEFSIFTIGEYRKHGFIKVGERRIRDIRDIRDIRVFDLAIKRPQRSMMMGKKIV